MSRNPSRRQVRATQVEASQVEAPQVEATTVEAPAQVEQAPAPAKKLKVAPRTWTNSAIITVLVPKAKGDNGKSDSADRYNLIPSTGMSVAEYTKLVGAKFANGDLKWNVQRGFVSISEPEAKPETPAAE